MGRQSRGGAKAIATQTRSPAPSTQELSDRQAVERARDGDHDAFGVLVTRYQERVYRLALRILRDEEQARDAAQDAFLKAYRALRRFEGRSSFYTWLYRLVFNLCLDMRRRDRSNRHVEWDEERFTAEMASTLPPALEPGPERALERAELRRDLSAAIDRLPDDARQTLLLREVDGLQYAEIAETMGIPKGTVMSRLYYARRRVKASLLELRADEVEQ